jgi:hypothetical protein
MSDEQETQFELDTDDTQYFVVGVHPVSQAIRKHEIKRSVNPNRDNFDFMTNALRTAQSMHNDGFTNIILARSAIIVTCRFVPPESQGGWHQLSPNEPQPPENDND